METIQLALSDEAIHKCWDVLKEARPHLKASDFLYQIRKLQVESSYNLAFVEKEDKAVIIIGFVITENLSDGLQLRILELHSLEQDLEIASELLEWAFDYAKTKKCKHVALEIKEENKFLQELCQKYNFKALKKIFYLQ